MEEEKRIDESMANQINQRSTAMKIVLGLIAISCLTYSGSFFLLEVETMKISFWGIVLLAALVGGIAGGIAYKQHQIEINGIKVEVDLRHAKRVDSFKVGDKVRVLVKKYSDLFYTYAGIIVGFDNFIERPTIIIAYVEPASYDKEPLKFVFINKDTKDVEIAPMVDDFIAADKSVIIAAMDAAITKSKQEIQEMEARKAYFLKYFGAYFDPKAKE